MSLNSENQKMIDVIFTPGIKKLFKLKRKIKNENSNFRSKK
ncbi:MAG: hypothetical protein ACI81I_000296 [Arcobacteraceae bacterium]|jgi:hypothetical protein